MRPTQKRIKPKTVIDFLAKERRNKAWLAVKIGVHPNSVQNWLSGRAGPGAATVSKLAELIGTTPRGLLK